MLSLFLSDSGYEESNQCCTVATDTQTNQTRHILPGIRLDIATSGKAKTTDGTVMPTSGKAKTTAVIVRHLAKPVHVLPVSLELFSER